MKGFAKLIAALALIASTSWVAASPIMHAVQDPDRLEEHLARDASRQPEAILSLSGIQPGHHVLEIAPAGGYYTALLSRVVGGTGKVHAVDPERIFVHFPRGREGFPAYQKQDPRDNVEYSIQYLDDLELPEGLDQVWMVLYYHDTVWTGEDRAKMNADFFRLLKPGGTYLVVDHHGVSGAPDAITQGLHRIDAEVVRKEILAAGFELSESSELLTNPDDPRDDSVFLPERRGQTDRFVWRFTRP